MPRQARTISATNVYHAILRGVNKQQVFEDDEDYIRFLNVLPRQTQPDVDAQGQTFQPRCHVYAYCLMGNHVHLLLKEGSSHVSQAFHTPLFKSVTDTFNFKERLVNVKLKDIDTWAAKNMSTDWVTERTKIFRKAN